MCVIDDVNDLFSGFHLEEKRCDATKKGSST